MRRGRECRAISSKPSDGSRNPPPLFLLGLTEMTP
jgi:hypothetical protein